MNAEIITIGDEILIGQIIDSNSAFIAKEMNNIGISVVQITTISDNADKITKAIQEAEKRAEIIILTGGLGPTKDDITKHTIAKYFNSELIFNNDVCNHVEKLLAERGIKMNELNRNQAFLPEKAEVLFNGVGTAAGMLFQENNKIYVSMPGVPFEMKFIIKEKFIPFLKANIETEEIVHKTVMTQGIPESHLAKKIEVWETNLPTNIKLAYLPQPGIVRLRLSAKSKNKNELIATIDNEIEKLHKIIPKAIYGYNEDKIETIICNLLSKSKQTLSTAESCTGGNIAALITSVAGSSNVFKGSIVAYSNPIKNKLLNVQNNTLNTYGAVSKETVKEMCSGLLEIMNTDFAISISGIAGPTGGTEEKPVGTTWICVASKEKLITQKFLFGTDRIRNIRRASLTALNMLRTNFLKY